MSNDYQPIPDISNDDPPRPPPRDFNPPPPASWKRALLLAFIAFLFWLSLRLSTPVPKSTEKSMEEMYRQKVETKYGPDVIHAKRYSPEHKYRPAASPVITERTKDGRVRLRGANPAGVL